MTRMSKEFSLVLLGAGILTAGYFLWPEDDLQAKAQEQAQQQVAGNGQRGYYGGHFIFIPYGSSSYARVGGSTPAMANVSRGGFGSFGTRAAAS